MYFLYGGRSLPSSTVIAIFVAGPLYSLFLLFGVPALSVRHQAMKDLLEYGLRYRFSEHSVFVRGPQGTSELEWRAFARATRIADFYALRLKAGIAYIVPRSAFASPEEEESFLALLRSKLGATAKL